jgi:leucyl aminopeptidase (aminopeptidase T)
MIRGGKKIIEQCAGVKEGENVVISTDSNKIRIAEVLAGLTLSVGGVPTVVMIPPSVQGMHGAQLPKPVVSACRDSDVFLLPTTWSQTHTDARIEALLNNARGATLCEVTEDCLCVGGILADFEECDRIGRKIGARLSQTSEMRITTVKGTDIKGEVSNRPVQYETGLFREPGQFAAIPDSELNISPVEGTAEGTAVIDVRVMQVGVTRDEPVTLIIEEGKIRKISGGVAADMLDQLLENTGEDSSYNIAEFAIGLNQECREYATNLEDLGKLGHFHIGIGSSYAIGGKVKAPCHIDAIGRDAMVYFDDELVYDKGVITI